MIPKSENNYSLLVSPIMLPKAIISIGKKRIQLVANYIKPTKSSKFKENNIN